MVHPSHSPDPHHIQLIGDCVAEIQAEAKRVERTPSWIIQRAWKIARKRIQAIPRQD